MASETKTIYVYDGFNHEEDILLGRLYVDEIRGSEAYSFEFETEWLSHISAGTMIDPGLACYPGRQFSEDGELFGMFKDAAPDRWGRNLMNRRERQLAGMESRKPKKLRESDYLLGVFDRTRMGGLRFKTNPNGTYESDEEDFAVPPWTGLRTLEEASRNFEKEDGSNNEKWLSQLIRPGSSLGGARPKASISDENGNLWIAKFPSRHDENDTGAWEMVAHDIAVKCELNVPEAKLEKFSKYGSTFITKRFDRDHGKRVHYASSMTLLGKRDGASAQDGTSYLDIAGFIRAYGASPRKDLIELWRRVVFSMAVTNTDDHLRNHAFILTEKGWTLSPLFDVNPEPYGNELAINVDESSNVISLDLAINVANKFGIDKNTAKKMATEIIGTVDSNWEKTAKNYNLSRAQIDYMRPAFALPSI